MSGLCQQSNIPENSYSPQTTGTFILHLNILKVNCGKYYNWSKLLAMIIYIVYFSQKQLPSKIKSRLVIIECAGYIL